MESSWACGRTKRAPDVAVLAEKWRCRRSGIVIETEERLAIDRGNMFRVLMDDPGDRPEPYSSAGPS